MASKSIQEPGDAFNRRKFLSAYWHNKAMDLHGSAGALWECMHATDTSARAEMLGLGPGFSFAIACGPSYRMLCGMALELLIKATLVAKGDEPETIHSLVALSDAAAIPFSNKQLGLLRLLSEAVIWEGRYPVPKNSKRFEEYVKLNRDHCFDRVPSAKVRMLRPNDSLGWESFNLLWGVAQNEYSRQRF